MQTPPSILIVYTGGTIGMKQNPQTGALSPFNFEQIEAEVPELQKLGYTLSTCSFDPLVDSSDIMPDFWVKLAQLIADRYEQHDGFVVLHGTDTMSYTASALSFMLSGLAKPVVLTGSQLPIGMIRTDGKENLISAIEVAAARHNGQPMVPEVCIMFQNRLYRGNRTTKHNADHFNAFRSYNYPPLAEAGISIKYNHTYINRPNPQQKLSVQTHLDNSIAVLTLYPGISAQYAHAVLSTQGLRALVLLTYGSGNSLSHKWFVDMLADAIAKGLIVLNVSQCQAGSVDMDKYDTGLILKKIGVVSGYDITLEAAVTKLMFLLGSDLKQDSIKNALIKSISGEISTPQTLQD